MTDLSIVLLDKQHNRTNFDCGEKSLNDFIRKYAGQNMRSRFNITYVLLKNGENDILAYYSMSAGQIRREDAPDEILRRLPKYPIPAVLLGRLAVDKRYGGQRYGSIMLVDLFQRAVSVSDALGVYAIEVYALNPLACSFYKKHGFQSLKDDQSHLYLPIATATKALR